MAKKSDKPSLVLASRVKEHGKKAGLRSSADYLDAVNDAVRELLDRAAKRAKANKRGTLRPQDL